MKNFCGYDYNFLGNNIVMKQYVKWSIEEEQDLINLVSKCRQYNLGLNNAFLGHSKKYDRSKSAVKKHYYSLMPKGDKNALKNALLEVAKRSNVVSIKDYQKPALTEKDLQALFRGLVRLIKENVRWD